MNKLGSLVDYLLNHPAYLVGAGLFFGLYFLLGRKTALTRQGEQHLGELRKKRGGHYNKLRPPQ